MRKAYKLQDLECANCAAKMSDEISKLDGVNSAKLNFLTQKMVLDIDDAAQLDEILDKAQAICKKIEPDMVIVR